MKVEDIYKEYLEDQERVAFDWVRALTFGVFKKYDFEWDHRHSQEENVRAFLEAVENYGREEGYVAGYQDGGLFAT